jgi:nucleoside-diphosphate-sugar epimerase
MLAEANASIHEGTLEDTDSLKRGSEAADAVIHIAFAHDFSDFLASVEKDRRAIEAMGEALAGSGRPFIVTSGVPAGKNGQVITEDDDSDPAAFPRLSEAASLPFAKRGVLVSVVRPSRLVHGCGDAHGFVPRFIDIARKTGISAYAGDGANRCQAVHRLDVACLFRLVLERANDPGARYQAVGEQGVTFREIATAIGNRLNIPAVSISAQEAAKHFGFLGQIVGMDNPASSGITSKTLGWNPSHSSLLQDLATCYDLAFDNDLHNSEV